jgi:hypothetical protein
MSGDASWNVEDRIYDVLTGAPALAGGRVFGNVPPSTSSTVQTFPYIHIGETDAIPDDVSPGDDGQAENITLHVWSRYAGQKEVKQLMDSIKTRLHGVELAVSGRASAISWVRSMRNFNDPDGKTRHGVVGIEVIHRN